MSGIAWQTACILAACALSYGLALLCGLKEEYWALITAVVVIQPELTGTMVASGNRIVGTLIGAVAGFFVLEGARHGLPLAPLFWGALVPLAVLTSVRQNLRLSCITLIVVGLIPSDGGAPFDRPLDRVYGILLGTLASVIAAAVIRDRSRQASANSTTSAEPP